MPVDVYLAVGSAAVCYAIASAFCCIGRGFAFALGFGFGRSCDLLLAHAQMPWLRSRGVLYSAHSVCEGRLRVRVCRCLRFAFGRPSTPHHIHSSHTTPRNIHTPHTPHTTHTNHFHYHPLPLILVHTSLGWCTVYCMPRMHCLCLIKSTQYFQSCEHPSQV